MKKSAKTKQIEEHYEVPKKLDYSTVPKAIEEAIKHKPYEIEKDVNLSWDGKQFMIRIPLDISTEMGITKENKGEFKVRFKLVKGSPNSDEITKVTMELMK
ncbi:hypothetical protein ACSAZL_01180 [Methanosarcina sp. T3]|uniref:hypothetical protein n=1 Tax=Methanosarcina sp. T3 TaxID=3439062 RepID=UPI003F874D8E